MFNENIINCFKKLIKLIELETNYLTDKKQIVINQFRIASLRKSLRAIITLNFQITNSEQIKDIKNIGKGTMDRVDEILNTGTLKEISNYDKIIKKSQAKESIIDDLMKIVGIGRIMANNLITEYKIKSAEELKQLSDSGKIQLNNKIKLGLKYLGKFQGSIPRSEIDIIYDHVQHLTNQYNPLMFITICGSYRRELPFSSDIDILLSDLNITDMDDINNELSNYVKYLHQKLFLLDDITDKNIKTKYMGFGRLDTKHPIRRIDIRLIPMISYYPALLYFTGSYELNQEMRQKAKQLGYKLNEYGLYDLNNNDEPIYVLSEQEIFKKLDMIYLPAIKR